MKLKIKWKFLINFFRREDPMKLKIIYIFIMKKFNIFIIKYYVN